MEVKEAIQSIQTSIQEIVSTVKGISPELLHWKPAHDKWSIMEVLVHVEEAVPYWLNEISRLLENPGTEWGRGLQDPQRLAAVANAGSRNLDDVIASIEGMVHEVERILAPISADQLKQESPSRNPRFGTQPLSFVIQHLLVEHVDVHDKQIKRNIEQFKRSN